MTFHLGHLFLVCGVLLWSDLRVSLVFLEWCQPVHVYLSNTLGVCAPSSFWGRQLIGRLCWCQCFQVQTLPGTVVSTEFKVRGVMAGHHSWESLVLLWTLWPLPAGIVNCPNRHAVSYLVFIFDSSLNELSLSSFICVSTLICFILNCEICGCKVFGVRE